MDYFEFFQSMYKTESERRAQLSSLLPIPIGIFTVVGGGFYAMAQGLSLPLSTLEVICASLLVVTFLLGVAAAVFLVRFQFGHKYRYLATAEQIEAYRASLAAYYGTRAGAAAQVDREVKDNIQGDYVECSSFNARANDRKTRCLYITNSFLAACAIAALAASIPFSLSREGSAAAPNPLSIAVEIADSHNHHARGRHVRQRQAEAAARPKADGRQQAGMAAASRDSRE